MIPFSPPYIDKEVIDEVVDTLQSGWITTGPKVKALEEEIADFIGIPNVLCVNSWTSGAIMVLKWLGLQEGDEVIIPAYTYSATALAVIHAGGKPIMVDVDDDFNMNPEMFRNAVTPKTKAVIPVDFAGYPCKYQEIYDIANDSKVIQLYNPTSDIQKKLGRILVLSDAAHSLGARYQNKGIGHKADVAIFSLHAVKNVTTAEGGAIAINMPLPFSNEDLYADLRLMTLNCQTKDAYSKSQGGNWKYDITGLGMKINMADLNAAMGLAQMRVYPELLQRRKEVFERYLKNFEKIDWIICPNMHFEGKESSCHLFPLRIKGITGNQRDAIIREITNLGVSVNVHFIPLPMLTFFKGLGYDIADYPKAYENFITEISLPIYPQLTDEEINKISSSIISSYGKVVETYAKIVG